MENFVIAAPPRPSVAVWESQARFAVHRIYCVGRNYADHVREMGNDPAREPPIFFQKPSDAIAAGDGAVAYPPRTNDLHHEVELVIAIGSGGRDIPAARALDHVYGYAVGIDWTRRDLQQAARATGAPWDNAKGFDQSASISAIHPVESGAQGARGRIWLSVNGQRRQDSEVAQMIWSVPEIIAELSSYYTLQAGDLIYTGTPAGVGAVARGDHIEAGIDGLATLDFVISG